MIDNSNDPEAGLSSRTAEGSVEVQGEVNAQLFLIGGGHTHKHTTHTDFLDKSNFKKPGVSQP